MKRCDDHHSTNAMQDRELKKLLLETCPVRPGQEARAWTALREHLYGEKASRVSWSWLYVPSWRGLVVAAVALALIPVMGNIFITGFEPHSFATADSQAPGIYATAFYSKPAQAQVVWLLRLVVCLVGVRPELRARAAAWHLHDAARPRPGRNLVQQVVQQLPLVLARR